MTTPLTGRILQVTFTNKETGFSIAKMKAVGMKNPVTILGYLFSPAPGEVLEMEGEWEHHPKYGEQYKVGTFSIQKPTDVKGIRNYLSSGVIRGIGEVTANRIVDHFGKKTLKILDEDIDRLCEVEGIGRKRVVMIRESWEAQKEILDVMIFLRSYDISAAYAAKIFKKYGNDAVPKISENPYRLAEDIIGIGFIRADDVARKMGFSKDSPFRIKAGVIFVLNSLVREGHVFYFKEDLIEKAGALLDTDKDKTAEAVSLLSVSGEIVVETLKIPVKDSILTEKAVYLRKFHIAEARSAAFLKQLNKGDGLMDKDRAVRALSWASEQLTIILSQSQEKAVLSALTNKISVITGGPGTGKTTVINAVLKVLLKAEAKVLMAAPTGRAAKRMSEATGVPASTIHRLLEYGMTSGGFQKNEADPLECDFLIVDETSMVDIMLMYCLLRAVPDHAGVILVGDIHQLPSVGPGAVLSDIIESGIIPTVYLNEIFRQAEKSGIIVNAHRINKGEMPLTDNGIDGNDFYFIRKTDPEDALSTVVQLVKDRIPKHFGFDAVNDIQVITPMHKGILGAENLNRVLQEAINPESPAFSSEDAAGIAAGGRVFRKNDKVIQIKNNYDKGVFNGDIGRIEEVFPKEKKIHIRFDENTQVYEHRELEEIVLAYAVTVHKSQGSEFPAVVLVLHTQHYIMLKRNLFYTAVTRGKRLVVTVGLNKAAAVAVRTTDTLKRNTYLAKRLKD